MDRVDHRMGFIFPATVVVHSARLSMMMMMMSTMMMSMMMMILLVLLLLLPLRYYRLFSSDMTRVHHSPSPHSNGRCHDEVPVAAL